jgi:hypothetical protein
VHNNIAIRVLQAVIGKLFASAVLGVLARIIFLKLGSLEIDPTRFSIPSNAFLQNSREKHEIWLEILNLYFPRQI